jgi:hypothetical protein
MEIERQCFQYAQNHEHLDSYLSDFHRMSSRSDEIRKERRGTSARFWHIQGLNCSAKLLKYRGNIAEMQKAMRKRNTKTRQNAIASRYQSPTKDLDDQKIEGCDRIKFSDFESRKSLKSAESCPAG